MFQVASIKVCITGAAGRVGYSLLMSLVQGEVFGKHQPLILSLLGTSKHMEQLQGISMELKDCASPFIKEVIITDSATEAFKDIDAAFLVASAPFRPERPGRSSLLSDNAVIFSAQGAALDSAAKKSVKVLILANPTNTNTLICSRFAPSIPKENFSCLSRLDQNRAQTQIALRLGVPNSAVKNVIVWGNHSSTMFPDVAHGTAILEGKEKPLPLAIGDDVFIRKDFVQAVMMRGMVVLGILKKPTVMAAAHAAAEHMRDWWCGTEKGRWVCMGVISQGEYGVPQGLVFSYPVTVTNRTWTIVKGLQMDGFARSMLERAARELQEEKEEADRLLC